jgi:hypothetical protein
MNYTALDTIFSRYIRLRDADELGNIKCCTCGVVIPWKEADCSHFIPRSNLATRWLEMNCHAACVDCNRMKHGNLEKYADFLRAEYGPDAVMILEDLGRSTHKMMPYEVRELVREYKKKIKEL